MLHYFTKHVFFPCLCISKWFDVEISLRLGYPQLVKCKNKHPGWGSRLSKDDSFLIAFDSFGETFRNFYVLFIFALRNAPSGESARIQTLLRDGFFFPALLFSCCYL